jgi:hypothetical protein
MKFAIYCHEESPPLNMGYGKTQQLELGNSEVNSRPTSEMGHGTAGQFCSENIDSGIEFREGHSKHLRDCHVMRKIEPTVGSHIVWPSSPSL